MTDNPVSPSEWPDSDKLILLAAWFDMWDKPDADRRAILDDDRFPGKNDVQVDLRRIAAALADSAPAVGLDAAWAEVEAALQEGWRLVGVRADGSEWHATAEPTPAYETHRGIYGVIGTTWLGITGTGPTPTAALLALAAALRARPDE